MGWSHFSSKSILLRYNPKHVYPPVAMRYLASPLHPLQPKIAHMWKHRDRNTLWSRVAIHALSAFKRVVRAWSARRGRVAFQEALKLQGFDKLGVPLPNAVPGRTRQLKGTMEIVIFPSSVKQPHEAFQRDMNRLLEDLLRQEGLHHDQLAEKKKWGAYLDRRP